MGGVVQLPFNATSPPANGRARLPPALEIGQLLGQEPQRLQCPASSVPEWMEAWAYPFAAAWVSAMEGPPDSS